MCTHDHGKLHAKGFRRHGTLQGVSAGLEGMFNHRGTGRRFPPGVAAMAVHESNPRLPWIQSKKALPLCSRSRIKQDRTVLVQSTIGHELPCPRVQRTNSKTTHFHTKKIKKPSQHLVKHFYPPRQAN